MEFSRIATQIIVIVNPSCSVMIAALLVTVFRHVLENMRRRTRIEVELGQATRAKGQFFAGMSTEIRIPMLGVLGISELASETELTSQRKEHLEIIKSSTESALAVLEDTVESSKR